MGNAGELVNPSSSYSKGVALCRTPSQKPFHWVVARGPKIGVKSMRREDDVPSLLAIMRVTGVWVWSPSKDSSAPLVNLVVGGYRGVLHQPPVAMALQEYLRAPLDRQ